MTLAAHQFNVVDLIVVVVVIAYAVSGFRNGAVATCLSTLMPGVLGQGYFRALAALVAEGPLTGRCNGRLNGRVGRNPECLVSGVRPIPADGACSKQFRLHTIA